VNAFLLDSKSDGLTLVDAGVARGATGIREAVHSLGRDITEVRHILVTHCHPDHAGGLAKLKALTNAQVYIHRRDAMLVATGRAMRRLVPSPGIPNAVLYQMMIAPKPTTVPPVRADVLVGNGDVIPVAGGISVIHTPGHTEGHLVFLAEVEGSYSWGMQLPTSLALGHGPPIRREAGRRFRDRWGQDTPTRRRGGRR
jgi:glyoxylase-like metal-dependent hydrolase (beta-lactamase superfamily II)